MKDLNLKGVIPAAILPMTADFEPDYRAFAKYVDWLVAENAVAIAVNMDTGEGPQLSASEKRRVIETAVEAARGRCGIVSGVMGGTTRDAAEAAKSYREAGADGLVVFPNAAFRNEPLDHRIPVDFHQAIAGASGLPIVLFQLAPIFGGVNFSRETLLKLLEIPEVVAIKEASFDAQYFAYTVETVKMSDHKVTLLTGNDRFITESFLLGAEGALLGFCAIGCGLVAEMLRKFQEGDCQAAVAMRDKVQGFANVIYQDPMLDYRARCKVALAHIGVLDFGQVFVRPPMLQIGETESKEIRAALIQAGMLKDSNGWRP
jgi:4-hydroxy-tetrahydrodipicolinate synthase